MTATYWIGSKMTIFHGSRYRFEDTVISADVTGEVLECYPLRETTGEIESDFRRYRVAANDTMESIAFVHYGDANKWYIIADLNPQIFWPLDLAPGMEIILPSKVYAEMN